MKFVEEAGVTTYLERTGRQITKKSGIDEKGKLELEKKLSVRLTMEAWKAEGEMQFDFHNDGEKITHCEIEYDSEFTPKLYGYLSGFIWSDYSTTINQQNFRRIKQLKISSGTSRLDLEQLSNANDMYAYVGDKPFEQSLIPGDTGTYGLHSQFIGGVMLSKFDPTTLFGLAVLLHEIGHLEKERRFSPEERASREKNRLEAGLRVMGGGQMTPQEKATYLESERAAHAFALSSLYRLFGKGENIEQLKKVLYASLPVWSGQDKKEVL